jgi:hypothetical protein
MTEADVFQFLRENSAGLIFDYMGSESGEPLEAIHLPARLERFNREAFIEVMGLDPNRADEVVSRFEDPEEFYEMFPDSHAHLGDGLRERAERVVDVLRSHLQEVAVIVVGKEGYEVEPERPAYILGRGSENNLVGYKTQVVWT